MLLSQFNQFYDIVAKHDPECIAFNDHHANIVIQFNTGNIEEILKEIKNILPAGMSIGWAHEADAYEITFYEGGMKMDLLIEKYISIWFMISAAQEFGVDISKDLAPLKTYTGSNQYILELKEYCEAEGMI